MAGSDKNAARSSTGRSKIEPPQPLGEAESSSLAGQLLNSLKAASPGAAAVSHEARLGMMVITILFFAFCFLVYHKMDLHQRQLTQASIQPTAEPSGALHPLDTAAQLATQSQASAATDPLMSFASTEPDPSDESFDNSSVQTPEFGALDTGTLSRTEDTPSAASEEAFTSDQTFAQSDTIASTPRSAIRFEFDVDESTASNEEELTEPAESEMTLALTEPELSSESEPDAAGLSFDTDEPIGAFVQETPLPVSSAIASVPATSANSSSAAESFSTMPVFGDGAPEAEFDESESSLPDSTLVAMLDPQEGGFSGGFLIEEPDSLPVTSGRAPLETSDSFPSVNPQATASAPQHGNASASRGYNAVTHPGNSAPRNSVRAAAGSGSDGKFSLAAFNYQNTGAEPAPDDGSTFASIVVQDGDNYSKISKRVYGTARYFSALAVFNQHRISKPEHMRPGMIVLTPSKDVLEERYPQLFADSLPKVIEPAAFLLLDDGSPAYRVGERETLSEISQRFLGRSSRWIEIYRLNQSTVKDPNKLKAGLILALPADAAEVHVTP